MKRLISTVMVSLLLAVTATPAQAQRAASRGQLLYDVHCVECHTQQMHWRTLKQARDWDTLKAQVARWQDVAKLGWSDADVEEVARYLNQTIYQFPRTVSSRQTAP